MSLNYLTFVTSLANFLVIPVDDPNYLLALPNIIDDAEQLSYRDLDLLNTTVAVEAALTAGNSGLAVPDPIGGNGPIVVTQLVNVITPAGTAPPIGARNPVLPISKDVFFALYPSSAGSGLPQHFCMFLQNLILFGPWPDAPYTAEIIGTIRPKPLSASNQTTLLATYLPDVFLNAALVMGYGYLKDYGAMADDPKSGLSWQQKYDRALASASKEEARKKFQDQGWGSLSTGESATPPRT